jgi:predicted DNA-binding protein
MKKPPSRIRYEKAHPVVSARLDTETYQKLKEILQNEGKSFASFLKAVINKAHNIHRRVYQSGYAKAKKDWQMWYFCSICNERINLVPNSRTHKDIINYMKEMGWAHMRCCEREEEKLRWMSERYYRWHSFRP